MYIYLSTIVTTISKQLRTQICKNKFETEIVFRLKYCGMYIYLSTIVTTISKLICKNKIETEIVSLREMYIYLYMITEKMEYFVCYLFLIMFLRKLLRKYMRSKTSIESRGVLPRNKNTPIIMDTQPV